MSESSIQNKYKIEGLEEASKDIIKKAHNDRTLADIIRIVEQHPEVLKKLDLNKLKIIDQYYKDEIEKFRRRKV